MRIAIIVSVVAHVGLMLVAPIGDCKSPDPKPEVIPVATVTIEPPAPAPVTTPEPTPIEVAYLTDAQIAAVAAAQRDAPPKPATQRIATGGTRGNERAAATQEPSGGNEKPSLLSMRKPGGDKKPVVGMSQEFLDAFMKNTKPLVIPDLPGARIDHEISQIQSRMRDHRNADHYDPTGDRMALAALKEERAKVELKQQKDGTYRTEKETFVANVDRDGNVRITDKPNVQVSGLGLKFDVTDAAMRASGIDPYSREKLKFMDRTRDQRVAIGKEYRREVLSKSSEIMRANLERAWRMKTTTAARKQAVFDLWDEVAETGDAELVAGGVEARALLIRFVQTKLTGPDAFTAEEVARLNAKRTSKSVFAPL